MNKRLFILAAFVFYSIILYAQTQRIEFDAPAAYPEGVTYDKHADVFYVSSVRTGTVGKVNKKGVYTVYADSSLKSTFGMKIAPAQRQLWVCAGDPNYSQYRDPSTHKQMIRLIGFDLGSGKKIADIDLSGLYKGRHFANDLTIDDKGNIFITDSYSPVLYKVDAEGKASLFTQNNLFGAAGTGLNGVVWHPGGYLLVDNNANGCLLKVDLSNPEKVTRVRINQFFPGADGLLLDDQNNLVLVQNKGVNKIFKLLSKDDWMTAQVISSTQSKDMFSFPSTATMNDNHV